MAAMNTALQNFTANPIIPKVGKKAVELPINLAPSTVFAKGTILGIITSAAADVQTATMGGSPTGGTFTFSGTNPVNGQTFTTAGIAYNGAGSDVQTALTAPTCFGSGNVTVSGSAGGPWTITGAGALLNLPIPVLTAANGALTGGTNPAVTIAHTTIGRTAATYAAYNAAVAAAPGAPVLTGTGSAGTWPAGAHQVSLSGVNAQGETTLSPPSGITLTATQSINVAAQTGLDTSFTALNVYIDGMFAGTCVCSAGTSTATLFAEPANTGVGSADKGKPTVNTAYTIPNGAGTQFPRAVLKFDVATDAAGNITYGASAIGGPWGETYLSTPAYFAGYFDASLLVGLDANAVAAGSQFGKIISGTTSSGLLDVF